MSIEDGGREIRVELGSRGHVVRVSDAGDWGDFARFARRALDDSWGGRGCRLAVVVSDPNVRHLADGCAEALGSLGLGVERAEVPGGEAAKSWDRAWSLLDRLVMLRADRHAAVVPVGGGVVGDLAGFVAATYARGLPLLMVPTTLLAQVDSSVGGKVGINHPKAKNIIGAFHQPIGVWIAPGHLATLPARELRCGLAEVIKYGVILDPELFATLETGAEAILRSPTTELGPIVARCCRLKAGVVGRDEREETGVRAALNYGHTIGHAIEAVAGYGGDYQHGEAVAVGMVAEARLAERLGWIGRETSARQETLIGRFGLPTRSGGLDVGSLIDAMGRDKKNAGGSIRFVLPRAIGSVELTDAPTSDDLHAVLTEMTAT